MDGGVANAGNTMICPDCRAENIEGVEVCEGCGADLSNLKLPSAASELEDQLLHARLGEVAAQDALNVAPGDPVALAVHFMRDKGVECVLVQDEDGNIVGILTERDILLKAAGSKQDLMAMAVKEIMSPDPVMLREGDTLAVAMHKMSVGGFRHIPFVSGDGTTLLVSIEDVFRHVAEFIPRD